MATVRTDAAPFTYIRGNPPRDPKDLNTFLTNELKRIEANLATLSNLVPQVSIKAPTIPLKGMFRFAKAPWNPLGTGDAAVYYNGTSWLAV